MPAVPTIDSANSITTPAKDKQPTPSVKPTTTFKAATSVKATKPAPSTKPLYERLRIRSGMTLRTWPTADVVVPLITPLPDDVIVATEGPAQCAIAACSTHAELLSFATAHLPNLTQVDIVWILYPKGGRADLNRDTIWRYLTQECGWRLVGNIAVSDVWSAVRARALHPGESIGS